MLRVRRLVERHRVLVVGDVPRHRDAVSPHLEGDLDADIWCEIGRHLET